MRFSIPGLTVALLVALLGGSALPAGATPSPNMPAVAALALARQVMASATAMLEAHVTNAGERFRSDIAETMALLRTRQKELAGVYKGLLEERRGRSSSGCLDDHQARLDACQNRIAALADQRRRMDAILHALQHARHL
jgi:hypothetical protein